MLPLDDPKREYLLSGILEGFKIIDRPTDPVHINMDNYKSATAPENCEKVELQIKDEILNNQYVILNEPSKINIVSALGAIPKKNSDKIRLIHDCSRPIGKALNDYAEHNPFKYQSLQNAIDLIGKDYYLGKIDLSNAYRVVKVHPSNWQATGLKWTFKGDSNPTYMVDTRLPFGARRSPEVFNELTQAVRRIIQKRGHKRIIVYLDDFLIIGENYDDCLTSMQDLMFVLRKLGFRLNYKKIEGPVKCLTFLGLALDTVKMTISLPTDKLVELQKSLRSIYQKSKITKQGLQSQAGKLNWATQCVYGGRFHLRRILDRIMSLEKPWYRTRVTLEMKKDIEWWLTFMNAFNGKTAMVDNRPCAPVTIDACNDGAGGFYGGECVYTNWRRDWPNVNDLHINFKEVLALEPAVLHWGPLWSNKKIFIHSDNQAAVGIINKGSCRDPRVMASLRRIFWHSAVHNFRLKAVYYPGKYNKIADAVSRLSEPGGYYQLLCKLSGY